MKWREPWRESIKATASMPDSLRRIASGFLLWFGVFGALMVIYALTGDVSSKDLPTRAVEISLFAAGMAVLLHLVWLFSPRKVDSGPRGIILTKSDEMLLVPWQTIASFRVSKTILPGSVTLQLHSGETYRLVLPHDANATEISREITEMIVAQV